MKSAGTYYRKKGLDIRKAKPKAQVATKSYVKQQLGRALDIERKSGLGSVTALAVPSVVNLMSTNTYDSDQIMLKSCQFGMQFTPAATPCNVRIILFQYTADNANHTPVAGDILSLTSGPYTIVSDYLEHLKNIKILSDRIIPLNTAASGNPNKPQRFTTYKMNKRLLLGGSDLGTNMVYALILSDLSASGPAVTVNHFYRYTEA